MKFHRILHIYEGRVTPYPDNFAGIPRNLRYMGYDVVALDIKHITIKDYCHVFSRFAPDVVLCFLRDGASCRKVANLHEQYSSVPLVNWYTEDPNYIVRDDVLSLSSSFHFWFTINNKMVPFYKGRAYFLPPGFDQFDYYKRHVVRDCDVAYIGQLGHSRSEAMLLPYLKVIAQHQSILCTERRIIKNAENLIRVWSKVSSIFPSELRRGIRKIGKIFSLGPQPDSVIRPNGWFRPIDEYEKALVVARSKIAVGLSRVRGSWEEKLREYLPTYPVEPGCLFYQPKGRAFEGLGGGAMVLNDYYPELEDMFDVGKEIVTFEFGNLEEFSDKLTWYIRHDQERQRIAEAGHERSMKQHTMACRLRQILNIVGRGS